MPDFVWLVNISGDEDSIEVRANKKSLSDFSERLLIFW